MVNENTVIWYGDIQPQKSTEGGSQKELPVSSFKEICSFRGIR